ncbi:MAG TPA: hypothetical protein DDY13_13060 [Cytophagales bacterium]|jgi:uncharacterized membrane protein|nr:hypothetical protein [Cytophagales bacterium]
MSENREDLQGLLKKLEFIERQQQALQEEIRQVRSKISNAGATPDSSESNIETLSQFELEKESFKEKGEDFIRAFESASQNPVKSSKNKKWEWERFLGENLINKVGIVILIAGIAIGLKFAIDNDLISPLARIITGYFIASGLGIVAYVLFKSMKSLSAVLFSGATASAFLVTYFATEFYHFFSFWFAFVVMLSLVAITVWGALRYNQSIVALIGMVGAYAIPYLIGQEQGGATIHFGYMVLINLGLLIIAFLKNWKKVYYTAFVFTWLIFLFWYTIQSNFYEDWQTSIIFSFAFFIEFYVVFIGYCLKTREKLVPKDLLLFLTNTILYFVTGYFVLQDLSWGEKYLGLFTLSNSIWHLGAFGLVYRYRRQLPKLFYLSIGAAIVFVTLYIPVQYDASWVTILWGGEALVLFWVARRQTSDVFERLAYALIFLSIFSLVQDWSEVYFENPFHHVDQELTPFWNLYFATSLFVVIILGAVNYINLNSYPSQKLLKMKLFEIMKYLMPVLLILVVYFAFKNELDLMFKQWFDASKKSISLDNDQLTQTLHNTDILSFKRLWGMVYTFAFIILLTVLNNKRVHNVDTGLVLVVVQCLAVFAFLATGLPELDDLRTHYLDQNNWRYEVSFVHIGMRYLLLFMIAWMSWLSYKYVFAREEDRWIKNVFRVIMMVFLWWLLSDELLHWMDMARYPKAEKTLLSILWGVYALALVILGISKEVKTARIVAFLILGITLIKLFFYDLAELDTVSKTIVFIALGILLLVISYLYNRYKDLINVNEGKDDD